MNIRYLNIQKENNLHKFIWRVLLFQQTGTETELTEPGGKLSKNKMEFLHYILTLFTQQQQHHHHHHHSHHHINFPQGMVLVGW